MGNSHDNRSPSPPVSLAEFSQRNDSEDGAAELLHTLRSRALRWLSQREQSELELRRKLRRLANDMASSTTTLPDELPGLIDQLMAWLKERHYLSQQRFIEGRTRSRQSRFGMQRIQNELAQHGLSLSPEESQRLTETELKRAHAVWQRKFGHSPAADAAAKASQTRFLAQRGFSSDAIRRVLRGEGAVADDSGV